MRKNESEEVRRKNNFVEFVNGRRNTTDFIRWDTTYFEYTIEDFSMIELIEVENGINDGLRESS